MSGKKGSTKAVYQIVESTGVVMYQCCSKPEVLRVFDMLTSFFSDRGYSVVQQFRLHVGSEPTLDCGLEDSML